MGNFRSCEARSMTAKLILFDGQLQEFSWPIKVSLIQQNSDCFICSSDEMEFGEYAAAMGGDEVLQLGEIYFELPVGWRSHRLLAEDMAALAAKASLAFERKNTDSDDDDDRIVGCYCCSSRKVEPAILFYEKETALLAAEGGGGWPVRAGGNGCGGKGGKYVTKLSAIVED